MVSTLNPSEEAQLAQTIEMFEVITQSQPNDYQSLEILKEAYSTLGREQEVIATSKRIAQAHVQLGQFSSAILEYETILQLCPEDPDVLATLQQIQSKSNSFPAQAPAEPTAQGKRSGDTTRILRKSGKGSAPEVDDGWRTMHKIFVEGKIITDEDFGRYWPRPDLSEPPEGVVQPFIQLLADHGVLSLEDSLRILCEKARCAYLALSLYDIDMDLARSFSADTCQRWCVLPFDRMSKSIMVATTNPFNQQAAKELVADSGNRLLWYLVPPGELVTHVRRAFR